MSSGNTIKRIFISDIHIGDGRSVSPGRNFHPYCWFYDDRPDMLVEFLKQYCIDDESVAEVVIVGDLFDEWVCPTQFDPTDRDHQEQQFKNVANASQNQLVTAWLRELARQQRLIYLRGNHDMLANKPIMEEIFPGLKHQGRDDGHDDDGHDVYRTDDGIWAEHGHWYGLFNAPLPPRSGMGRFGASVLPLGFFISRVAAQNGLKTGKSINGSGVFADWIGHIHRNVPDSKDPTKAMNESTLSAIDDALMGLFDTLVKDSASDQYGALLNGLDNIPGLVTWQEVKDRYRGIFSQWSTYRPHDVNPYDALWSDAGSLDRAVNSIFHNEKTKIVICGHTHKCDFSSTLDLFEPAELIPSGTKNIYANTGAWTNDTSRCTFVETELNRDTGSHSVRLREWTRQLADGQYTARDVRPEESISKDVWIHALV